MKTHYLICGAICLATVSAYGQSINVNKENRTIAVTSTDEAEVTADLAAVTIGFNLYGTDQNQTYAEATKTSNAIIDALHTAASSRMRFKAPNKALLQ